MRRIAALAPAAVIVAKVADAAGILALAWFATQLIFGDSRPFEYLAMQVGAVGMLACLADRGAARALPVALVGYALAAIASAVAHRDQRTVWEAIVSANHFAYMLVFVFGAAYLLRTRQRMEWLVVLMCGAILVIAAQLLFDRASSQFVYNRADIRYIASVSQWAGLHQVGLVVVAGLPLCLAVTLGHVPPHRRVAAALLSLFLILAAWFNGSRTAILVMGMTVAGMTVLTLPRRGVGWRTVAGSGVLLVVAGLAAWAVFAGAEAIPAVTSLSGYRSPIWRAALQMFFDHPLLGVGPGAYRPTMLLGGYAEAYLPWYPGNLGGVEQAHNWPLQVAAETGILGISSLLWFFVVAWRAAFTRLRGEAGLVALAIGAALAAIFVRCLFDNFMGLELSAFRMRPFVWLFFAAAVAVWRWPSPGEAAA